MAASEFHVHPNVLSSKIKLCEIEVGRDGLYSTLDICRAIFNDYEGERCRLTSEQADLTAEKKKILRRESIPANAVAIVVNGAMADLRQKVLYSSMTDEQKQELLKDMQEIPLDEYFKRIESGTEEDTEAGVVAA